MLKQTRSAIALHALGCRGGTHAGWKVLCCSPVQPRLNWAAAQHLPPRMSSSTATESMKCDCGACLLQHSLLLILLGLCLAAGFSVRAQDAGGSVAGMVVNTWSGSPVSGVAVTVRG